MHSMVLVLYLVSLCGDTERMTTTTTIRKRRGTGSKTARQRKEERCTSRCGPGLTESGATWKRDRVARARKFGPPAARARRGEQLDKIFQIRSESTQSVYSKKDIDPFIFVPSNKTTTAAHPKQRQNNQRHILPCPKDSC